MAPGILVDLVRARLHKMARGGGLTSEKPGTPTAVPWDRKRLDNPANRTVP